MGQHCLENHDALFWDQPCCDVTKSHTLKKAQRIRNFRHTKGHDNNNDNNNDEVPFEGTTCNIGHDAVSWYLPSRQCAEPETTETREKISIKRHNTTRTAKNNPNTPSKSTNQIEITEAVNKSLPQHHLQLTFTRHKNKRL